MATWTTVVQLGTRLPDVEEGIWFRTPSLKVKGRSFTRLKEDGETLVVLVDETEKEVLMAAQPEVFFQTEHYLGWPAMLVRLKKVTRQQLQERLVAAWERKAPKASLNKLGPPRTPTRQTTSSKKGSRRRA